MIAFAYESELTGAMSLLALSEQLLDGPIGFVSAIKSELATSYHLAKPFGS